MAVARPIPAMRSDGTFASDDMEAWMRDVRKNFTGLAGLMNAVLTAGNSITLTYSSGAGTITVVLNKIAASANAASATVTAVTGTADGTYSTNEQTLINDLATAVNALITDVAAIRTALNDLKTKARTAGHLAT